VSLGVQSLCDDSLARLGRLHTAAEARAALDIARRTFRRFSFDMIYARPGQSPQAWCEELSAALGLAGDHVSLYQLTIEDGTPFATLHAAGKLVPPDGDLAGELFALTDAMTAAAGLPAYEISNHARPGEESRHNLLYWRYGEYAGIGAGAHGRLVVEGGRRATSNLRYPERWLGAVLTPAEMTDEALLMGLRLSEGLDLRRLVRLGGTRPSASAIAGLESHGHLESMPGDRIRATSAGRLVLNEIILRLSDSLDHRR
jgi:oxygen-independent coproporphyrinogen-3 oxidase